MKIQSTRDFIHDFKLSSSSSIKTVKSKKNYDLQEQTCQLLSSARNFSSTNLSLDNKTAIE